MSEITPEESDFNQFLNQELPPEPLSSETNSEDDFDRLLNDFLEKELEDTQDTQEELTAATLERKPLLAQDLPADDTSASLYAEEKRLYEAYYNFRQSVLQMADKAGLPRPQMTFSADEIYLRYRPTRHTSLNKDIYNAWSLMLEAQPVRLGNLPANPSDEQILEYAEKTTDAVLQMALISYVEVLIELESCEIAYNIRKAKARKRKIEKALYEEQQARQEKMRKYVNAVKQRRFPIDADRLISNYFKTARKDPDGARKILESNPATYAPIEIAKIPPRFFGMIKAKPEDGIKVNKEIARFLKNLKA